MSHLLTRITVGAATIMIISGCSTARQIRDLEYRQLTNEKVALIDMRGSLQANPIPWGGSHADIFIGKEALNKLFKVADGQTFVIEGVEGVRFRVNSIRMDFRPGVPTIKIDMEARHLKYELSVKLKVAADMMLIKSAEHQNSAELSVHITEVVPEASWGLFEFKLWLFVRQLLRIEAQRYINSFPKVVLPLSSEFRVTNTPVEHTCFEVGDAASCGDIRSPEIDRKYNINLSKWLVLPDGLHIYTLVNDPLGGP